MVQARLWEARAKTRPGGAGRCGAGQTRGRAGRVGILHRLGGQSGAGNLLRKRREKAKTSNCTDLPVLKSEIVFCIIIYGKPMKNGDA